MKLIVLLTLLNMHSVIAIGYSQRITIAKKHMLLEDVFREIRKQSGYNIIVGTQLLNESQKIDVNLENATIEEAMNQSLEGQPLSYEIRAKNIIIKPVQLASKQQEQKLKGQVLDEQEQPVVGATVMVKNQPERSTKTNNEGMFSLDVERGQTAVVSFIGFQKQEVNIVDQQYLKIILRQDETGLDEVVVVGYGARKREDLIGSVSTMNAENIQDQKVNTFQEAMIGQVSGVQFRQNGAPDGAPELTIRGIASLGNNTPLYVVDGFPLGNSTAIASQRDNYVLSSINPSDIESISVLKDASAKAIYGSRASNGVVIITTKKGRKGKPVITFGSSLGIQSIPNYEKPKVLNAKELYQYQLEFYDDMESANLPLGALQRTNREFLLNLDELGPDNNWFDLVTRSALVKDYHVGVRGGSENTRYNVSAAFQDRDGTLIHTGFERYSINSNLDIDINEKLRFGLNFAPTRSLATGGRTDAGANNFDIFNAVSLATWTDPTAPLYDENGMLTGVTEGNLLFRSRNINPVTLLSERVDRRLTNQLRLGTFLEFDLLKGLTAKMFGSMQYVDRRNNSFEPSRFPGNSLNPSLLGTQQASAQVSNQNQTNMILENTLNYNVMLDGKHDIDALVGYTLEKRKASSQLLSSSNLVDEDIRLPSANNSVEPTDFQGNAQTDANALVSLIARLNYAFNNTYYVTATMRRDGSSRFGLENRYGTFPSIAGAWRISNESFFTPLKGTISDLKIEGGYGLSGNNGLGNYAAQGTIGIGQDYVFGGSNAPGAVVTDLPNLSARWEQTEETNLGLDIGLLQNRVYISADYYNINSVDFLAFRPLPITSGFNGVIDNTGKINNKGFEIEVKWDVVKNSDFNWTMNLNYSQNRNKVVDIIQEEGFFFPGGSFLAGVNITEIRKGEPIGVFRGLNVTGLFTQDEINNPDVPKYPGAIEGSLKFEDVDGNGILNLQDVTTIGNANPNFTFGMSQRFNYKNFELSFTLDGSLGSDILLARNQFLGNQDDGQFNLHRRILDRFRPGDDPTTKSIPGTASAASRQFYRNPNSLSIQNGDYLWVRNITLGYTLTEGYLKRYFNSARIYLSVQNPILISSYDFGSLTVNRAADNALVRNLDYGAYPISRAFTLGFNIAF